MAIITAQEAKSIAAESAAKDGAFSSKQIGIADLFAIAGKICDASGGRVQLVRNEEDEVSTPAAEAAEFLKLDGSRLGRDLRVYNLIGRMGGEQQVVMHLLEEVALPLRGMIPAAYEAIKPDLVALGERVFEPNLHAGWRDVLA